MAFFTLGRASSPPTASDGSARRSRKAPAAETIEDIRRRARHRLMGAVVLVLAGVVLFPMLFDTQPRPVPVDVRIDIPDRNNVPPLVLAPAEKPPRAAVGNGLSVGEEVVAGTSAQGRVQMAEGPQTREVAEPGRDKAASPAKADPAPVAKPESVPAKVAVKPEAPKVEARTEPPAKTPAAPGDAARARALLEGRTADAGAAPAVAPGAERFIVQVGAFADEAKVREVRAKLERAGLKTYTHAVETKEGKRTTRVRLGPFVHRAEADKALARAKSLGLDGAILTL